MIIPDSNTIDALVPTAAVCLLMWRSYPLLLLCRKKGWEVGGKLGLYMGRQDVECSPGEWNVLDRDGSRMVVEP
jgi:hypothetical protein